MRELVIFLALFNSLYGLRYFPHYPTAECGDQVSGEKGLILPRGVSCDIYVIAQHGKKTVLDFFIQGIVDCVENPDALQVIGESGVPQSACDADGRSVLFSSTKNMTIRLKNLPQPVKTHLSIARPVFECYDSVPFATMLGVPFLLTNTETQRDGCPIILPSAINIELESATEEDDDCDVRAEVAQGRYRLKPTQSTGPICIGKESVKTEIYCGSGVLWLYSPPGAQIRVTLKALTKEQSQDIFTKRAFCA